MDKVDSIDEGTIESHLGELVRDNAELEGQVRSSRKFPLT